jgi:RNA polymerase sigma-70 factor (ECF subfamily)
MDSPLPLTQIFIAHATALVRHRLASVPELEQVLSDAVVAGRSAWRDVALSADRFVSYLARRAPAEGDVVQGLRGLNLIDLYIACACNDGNPRAIAALEQHGFGDLESALRRLRFRAAQIDDVKQRLRQELFVPVPGRIPGIAGYSGRGQLRRWMRVIGVRTARRMTRRDGAEIAIDDHLTAVLPSPEERPDLAHMKRHYRDAFREAFGDAMRVLSDADRGLLRQHVIDGLGIDDLSALHGVHRATAARWLSAIRESIASLTRESLMARLGVTSAEYASVIRLIQSQLDISLRGYLADGPKHNE